MGDSAEKLQLRRWLDQQDTATPFDGSRRMMAWVRHQGDAVNPKRVGRWLRHMGLEALYPNPRLSPPAAGQTVYPYLLRGMRGDRVNQVWSAEITEIRLQAGLVSLLAVSDWCSRDVLSWAVSSTMDVPRCVAALDHALSQGQPEIFHTDPGGQLTSQAFTARLQEGGIQISMDGRGRALDHVYVERWWRSVKDAEVYPRAYQTVGDARQGLARYVTFDHEARLHQALRYRPPAAVYRA